MEEWRLWVFLVLNLLLLAIFFTSMKPSTSSQHQGSKDQEMKIASRKKKAKQSRGVLGGDETCVYEDNFKFFVEKRSNENFQQNEEVLEEEKVEDFEESGKFSKEELNERVEAFIATFRLHLFQDSRKGRVSSVKTRVVF